MNPFVYERGEVALPKTTFARIRSAVRSAYNERREAQYAQALTIYETLVEQHQRGSSWQEEAERLLRTTRPLTFAEQVKVQKTADPKFWNQELMRPVPVNLDPEGWIMNSFFGDLRDNLAKPYKPKKKHFAPVKGTEMKHYFTFGIGYPTITFEDDGCVVKWRVDAPSVEELDKAREHPVAVVLFKMLGNVRRWSGLGGQIMRCDGEYVKEQYGRG